MNKKNEHKLSMMLGLENVVLRHYSRLSTLAAFADGFGRFRQNILRIVELGVTEVSGRAGKAQQKRLAREQMAELATMIGSAAFAYASVQNDVGLKAKLKIRKWELMRGPDTTALDRAMHVEEVVNGLLPVLGDYGVTALRMQELHAAIEAYNGLIGAPRAGLAAQVRARKEIIFLLAENMRILREELDGLALQFREGAFYFEYLSARRIGLAGSRKRSGMVSGGVNGNENKSEKERENENESGGGGLGAAGMPEEDWDNIN